jgi:hypothetical protein
MDYLSISRAKWKKQHFQAYANDLEARLQAHRESDVESHLRAHADREKNLLALIEQMKADHKSELTQVRESLTGAVKKLREDREQLLKALRAPRRSQGSLTHARDRSPRGSAGAAQANLSVACRALNVMWLNERDQMLAEKDAQICELREQVQSLRRGDGPIGEVMAHNWPSASAETKARLLGVTRPVNETFKNLEHLLRGCRDICVRGIMPWFDASTTKKAVDNLAEQRR